MNIKDVKNIYVGSSRIKRVWLGNTIIKDFTGTVLGLKDVMPYPIGNTLKDTWQTGLISTVAYNEAIRKDPTRWGSENEFKMTRLQPNIGTFDFTEADKICNAARANNKKLFIHTLIWANVVGSELRAKKGVWTTAQFESYFRNHIRTVMLHLQPWWDIIDGVDVVNEALTPNNPRTGADPGNSATYAFWADVLPDYIAIAFQEYKSIPHGIPGFINDFIFEQSPAKCSTVLRLITDLAARGIVVDGIGSQNHAPVGLRRSDVEARYRQLASSGKKIHISELDIKFKNGATTANGWPKTIPGWSDSDIQIPDPKDSTKTITDKTRNIENTILKARPELLQLTSDVYTFYYSMYPRAVPPAQRFGITTWSVSDRDSHLNFPDYEDFPLYRFWDVSPKQAYYDLLNLQVPSYVP